MSSRKNYISAAMLSIIDSGTKATMLVKRSTQAKGSVRQNNGVNQW